MRKPRTIGGSGTAWRFGRVVPWAAVVAAGALLAGCSADQDAAAGDNSEGGGSEVEDAQEAADIPEGFQEIEAGVISYAVPDDWVAAPEAEEGEDLEYRYELLDEDNYILSFAGLVPLEAEAEEVEDLSAREVALDVASNYTIGHYEHERETDQEIEVPGARDSARNDHVLEERQHDFIEENNITDVIVISESDEVAVFRMNIGDDTVDEAERQQIIDSIRVN